MKSTSARWLCCLLVLLALPALGQEGSLTGSVLHALSQQPLAGVKVSAASPVLQGERVTTTDARGLYTLRLPPGRYALRFEKESFSPVTRTDVEVKAGPRREAPVALHPALAAVSGSTFQPLAPFAPPLRLESDGVAWMAAPRVGDIRDRAPPWALPQNPPPRDGASAFAQMFPGSKPLRDSDTRGHGVNPTIDTEEERVSTYTFQMSTASYALARGYLERDTLPAEESVRVEDFVNSFDLGPSGEQVGLFFLTVEGFPSPSRKGYHVVRVSVCAREALSDVGVQLEFERGAVSRYRLVGYENQSATPEKPSDDDEETPVPLAKGACVTAIYEVKLLRPAIAFGTLRILYEQGENTMWRRVQMLMPSSTLRSSAAKVAPATRLAYVAAAFAEKLRGSYWTRSLDWARLHALWEEVGAPLTERPDVVELGALIKKAGALDHRKDLYGPASTLSNMDMDNVPGPGK
ncbi:von Willebrand factor type A domain-containing protein [Myxococcus sp. K15C18031901]|uniref:YfbK domain-containing protein n=1 Tax=Myxococcus dinghuensis TaxID=2906761 RepID=UPI0020A72E16|nr:von Willebrand factor type A domain-containing protein [Myxococcus dinghuensis]MCP3104340.1 von Willebrand factor type A domain-containing protein [Myxococcus dinghuensis]